MTIPTSLPVAGPSRRRQLAIVLILAAILIPYGARLDEFLLSRSSAVVRVTDLRNIPRQCPTPLNRWSPRGLLGSNRVLRRCGAIWTDHGRFRVLPSASFLPGTMSREEIVDLLRAGGCYEIHWFGYEDDPAPGEPMDTSRLRSDNTIHHAAPRDDANCRPLPPPPRSAPWEAVPEGLRVHLRVDLNAPSDDIIGIEDDLVLRLRIAAPPGGGQGNEALMGFLARNLDLPLSAIVLVSGEGARRKTVLVQGNPGDLISRVETLLP